MRALLVMVCVCACAAPQAATVALQQAATVVGGDGPESSTCNSSPDCPPMGGGTGSLLLPLAVIGAAVVVIAGVSYVYSVVQPPARIAPPARSPGG
jgi:hypothetical protein